MARRKVEKATLFSATEALLIEQGYQGFHFKSLSERLKIGRSTLYEYYTSKEELITDYLEYTLKEIVSKCNEISSANSLEILKSMLRIFLKYSQIHQIALVIPFINPNHSPKVEASLANLKKDHDYIYIMVYELVENGKRENRIRDDIETSVLVEMIFHTVQVSNPKGSDEEHWIEMVLAVLFSGIGNSK